MTQNDTNRVINEDQFFEWWNSDDPFTTELPSFNSDTPLFWALQGWAACARVERKLMAAAMREWIDAAALGNFGKPNYTQPIESVDETLRARGTYSGNNP
jgi:hypothetical protein